MRLVIERSAVVITPTIGSPKLADAIAGVQSQTYKNVQHLLVVDGEQHYAAVEAIAEETDFQGKILTLPYNTGKTGGDFYGHRIYSGVPHFLNQDYVFFLDEDNWYESNHVETLANTLGKNNSFAYSLRQIYSPDKKYIIHDNCESLGKWPIYFTHGKDPQYLIDTSSFAFTLPFIQKTSHLWHSGWGGDRKYFYAVKDHVKWDCSYEHSLCYRLDGNENSVNEEFFRKGNAVQLEHYNGKMPWLQKI